LLQQRVVQLAHQFAGLQGDGHLPLQVLRAGVHQEVQAAVFLLQVLEIEDVGFRVGVVHVVNAEFLEIANDDPARVHAVGQQAAIAPRLLEGREHGAVGLTVGLGQGHVHALLLDQHGGIVDIGVDEDGGAGPVVFHRKLKGDVGLWLLHAVDRLEQLTPEILGVLLLVPAVLPRRDKCFRCVALFHIRHLSQDHGYALPVDRYRFCMGIMAAG